MNALHKAPVTDLFILCPQVQMPTGKAWKSQNMTYFSLVSEFARRVSQVALVRASPDTHTHTNMQTTCINVLYPEVFELFE